MFTHVEKQENSSDTIYTAHTDRQQIRANQEIACFLYDFRNSALLKRVDVHLVVSESRQQVKAA